MASERDAYPMDSKEHKKTYAGFLVMAKWSTIITVIVVAIVIAIISN